MKKTIMKEILIILIGVFFIWVGVFLSIEMMERLALNFFELTGYVLFLMIISLIFIVGGFFIIGLNDRECEKNEVVGR